MGWAGPARRQRLIDHWRTALPANRFIEVDYEDLTRAPEPAILRIIAACGLPWHDACLRPEIQSAGGEDTKQMADPAADLPHLGRALATLRTLAGAPARARRCEVRAVTGWNWTQVPPDRDCTEELHLAGKTRRTGR